MSTADDDIDSVAEELTAGAPRADLEQRVLVRLAGARPLPRWRRPALVAALASLLILALLLGRVRQGTDRSTSPALGSREPAATVSRSGAAGPTGDLRPSVDSPARGPETPARAAPSETASRVAPVSGTGPAPLLLAPAPEVPLDVPDTLAAAALQLQTLDIPGFELAVLEVDGLALADRVLVDRLEIEPLEVRPPPAQ